MKGILSCALLLITACTIALAEKTPESLYLSAERILAESEPSRREIGYIGKYYPRSSPSRSLNEFKKYYVNMSQAQERTKDSE